VPAVTLLDLALLAILALTVAVGAWAGFLPQLFGLVGGALGFGVGLLVTGALQHAIQSLPQPSRAFLALSFLLVLTLLGEGLGSAAGSRLRLAMRDRFLGALDMAGGMLIGLAQGILAIWVAAGLILAGALPSLATATNRSVVVRAINDVLPPPGGVAMRVAGLLGTLDFPPLFEGFEPSPAPPLDLPGRGVVRDLALSGEASTVQVVVDGCGREQLGTGFFVAAHVVVTNAHVVAGGDTISVAHDGDVHAATLVLFDPRQDVAVLRVPTDDAPALRLASSPPQRGTQAAALGHPGGGPLTAIAAVVTTEFTARGPDIYGSQSVNRDIVELRADVRRGDSGGPLLTSRGVVGGIVFGASRVEPDVGYAIAASSVATEIREGAARTGAVGSGACAND
jgi:S1-C subfamily serine protease